MPNPKTARATSAAADATPTRADTRGPSSPVRSSVPFTSGTSLRSGSLGGRHPASSQSASNASTPADR